MKERLYGMMIVSNEEEKYRKTTMFDGFEGIVMYNSWGNDGWYVVEGYYPDGKFQTKHLGCFPEEELDKAKNAKEMAEIIKKECLKLFCAKEGTGEYPENYEKNDEIFLGRFPDIAIDNITAQIIKSRKDYEAAM